MSIKRVFGLFVVFFMECLERINWICIVEYEIIVSVFVGFGFRRSFWKGFRGVTVFKPLLPRGCVFTVIFLFLNTVLTTTQ